MELIAITTFLTFANISGAVAATEVIDHFAGEQEGIVTVEEVTTAKSDEPQSLLEVFQRHQASKS